MKQDESVDKSDIDNLRNRWGKLLENMVIRCINYLVEASFHHIPTIPSKLHIFNKAGLQSTMNLMGLVDLFFGSGAKEEPSPSRFSDIAVTLRMESAFPELSLEMRTYTVQYPSREICELCCWAAIYCDDVVYI